jgi:hypothetical protein
MLWYVRALFSVCICFRIEGGGVTRALFGLALLNKNQLLSFEGFLMRMND